ncbi:MAG: FliM/FliN family flagellar motor switch protein [Planctomycetia bacterium]|nr:FliM/FliN family flagellar motor switch protein [Planctomycetia bacterium]
MTLQTHDFTRPLRLPLELKARSVPWLNRANAIFTESMGSLGLTLQAQSLDQNTSWSLETLDGWTGKPLGFRVSLAGSPTILALPNRLVQSLVIAMLGDSIPTEMTERDLSAVEISLSELTLKTYLSSLIEAWTDESPLTLQLCEREPNLRRSKIFRPREPLVVCRSAITIQGSEHLWSWLMCMETMQNLFGIASKVPAVTKSVIPPRQQMESLVRGMKLPLTVMLGQAQLTTSQLGDLKLGDVLVLHQRTTEPLKAFISGRAAFTGWPGQIAGKQAFQIESDLSK